MNGAASRHEHWLEISKGENTSSRTWSVCPQPSAFTTVKSVEEAEAKTIAAGLTDYRRNFHAVPSGTPNGSGG
jgi:hypothetical protein